MRNIEKLRDYFLGKDPYLKETMADNSLRLIGIPGREFVLRTELFKRIKELKDLLAQEAKARQDKDTELTGEIAREKLARVGADNTLTSLINGLRNDFNNFSLLADSRLDNLEDDMEEAVESIGVKALKSNLEINTLYPELETGAYYTGEYSVTTTLTGAPGPVYIAQPNTIFIYDDSYRSFDIITQGLGVTYPYELRRIWEPNEDENVWENRDYEIVDEIVPDLKGKAASTEAVIDYVKDYVPKEYPANTSYIGQLEPGIYIVPKNTWIYFNRADISPRKRTFVDLLSFLIITDDENDDTSWKFFIYCGKRADNGTAKKDGSSATYTSYTQKSPHEYSELEQDVGTWIDGKSLYEKTIQKTVEGHNLDGDTIEDVDEIFIKFGYVSDGDGAVRMLPYANGQALYVSVSKTLDDGARINFDNSSTSEVTFTVVVNYTKASE